jgi:signal transduction histidine kinase
VVAITGAEMEKWWQQPDATVRLRVFEAVDGAQPALANFRPSASMSRDGRLWFANGSLLQMVDPDRLYENGTPPPVHIEQMIADRKSYAPGENLRLPAHTRDLEIDYTALSFAAPQKVHFRYKLEGRDADWQDPQTRRQAFYSDLRPGGYRFRVIACNNDGLWNEAGAALDFAVLPAFYQTNWFILLCVGTFGCLVWAAYRWRVRQFADRLDSQFAARLAERTRIAQELHDTLLQGVLSACMQLHVADDLLAADALAKPLVQRVLELMQRVVEDGRNAVQGLRLSQEGAEGLDQAFSKIPQELAAQDAADFRVLVEGAPRPLHPVIRDEIYRIGREAVANAFRHSGARAIEIEIEYSLHELRLSVRDDGRGIDPKVLHFGREGHWGLPGMRERAERIGARLKVLSRTQGGTEVDLRIPGRVAFEPRTASSMPKWMAKLYTQKQRQRQGQRQEEDSTESERGKRAG